MRFVLILDELILTKIDLFPSKINVMNRVTTSSSLLWLSNPISSMDKHEDLEQNSCRNLNLMNSKIHRKCLN